MEHLPAKKSLGQNFLTNTYAARDIAEASDIAPDETVLEIGPGTGMLTRELLALQAHVIAIEADGRAVDILKKTFAPEIKAGRLTLINDDIRTRDIQSLGLTNGKYKVVANIPYYLSGMLFRLLLSGDTQPTTLVFLVQKEVARRIATDTKESLLSLSVKAYGSPSYIGTVSKGNFRPIPKVDSAILKVAHISKKRFDKLDEEMFFNVLREGLGAKRKQLLGNLTTLLPKEDLVRMFESLAIDLHARGEDLDIDTWIALSSLISKKLSTRRK